MERDDINFVPVGKKNVVFKLPIAEGRRLLQALDETLPGLLDPQIKKTVTGILRAGRICYWEHFDRIYPPGKGTSMDEISGERKLTLELYARIRQEALEEMNRKIRQKQ